ncbi:hypothetical protein RYB01_10050 [Pseudomonas syringae]|nr:hypothetical protein [Pseudomonas syringae]
MNPFHLNTQRTQTASPIHNLGVSASSMAAHDSRPEDIQAAFANGGLLIRTVQQKYAHKELERCNVDIDQARAAQMQGDHGGLRKWTLGHADLMPNFFGMGHGATGMPRHMAFLALPEKVGEHVVGIHDKDAASGNVTAATHFMHPADARMDLNNMLGRLRSNQKSQPGERLENNEVQTVGVEPGAIAGMLFHPTMAKSSWAAAKKDFQSAIDKGGPEFAGRTFPVFSYAVDNRTGRAELRLLDSLTKQN